MIYSNYSVCQVYMCDNITGTPQPWEANILTSGSSSTTNMVSHARCFIGSGFRATIT